jgi:hypothetical protein
MENPIDEYNAFFNERHHDISMDLLFPKARIVEHFSSNFNPTRDGVLMLTPSNDGGVSMNLPVTQIALPKPGEKRCADVRINASFRWSRPTRTNTFWCAIIPYESRQDTVSIEAIRAANHDPARHTTWWGSIDVWKDEHDDIRAKVALSTRVSMRVLIAQLQYVRTLAVIAEFVKKYAPHIPKSYPHYSRIDAIIKHDLEYLVFDELMLRAWDGVMSSNDRRPAFFDFIDLDLSYTNCIVEMNREGDSLLRFIKDCSRLQHILTEIIKSTESWRELHPAAYDSDRTYQFNNSIAPDRWLCVSLQHYEGTRKFVFKEVAFGGRTTFGVVTSKFGSEYLVQRTFFLDGWEVRIGNQDVLNEQLIVADDESLSLIERNPYLLAPDNLGRVFFKREFVIDLTFPTLDLQFSVSNAPPLHNVKMILDLAKSKMPTEEAESVASFKIYCPGYPQHLPDSMTVRDISALTDGPFRFTCLDPNWREDPSIIRRI